MQPIQYNNPQQPYYMSQYQPQPQPQQSYMQNPQYMQYQQLNQYVQYQPQQPYYYQQLQGPQQIQYVPIQQQPVYPHLQQAVQAPFQQSVQPQIQPYLQPLKQEEVVQNQQIQSQPVKEETLNKQFNYPESQSSQSAENIKKSQKICVPIYRKLQQSNTRETVSNKTSQDEKIGQKIEKPLNILPDSRNRWIQQFIHNPEIKKLFSKESLSSEINKIFYPKQNQILFVEAQQQQEQVNNNKLYNKKKEFMYNVIKTLKQQYLQTLDLPVLLKEKIIALIQSCKVAARKYKDKKIKKTDLFNHSHYNLLFTTLNKDTIKQMQNVQYDCHYHLRTFGLDLQNKQVVNQKQLQFSQQNPQEDDIKIGEQQNNKNVQNRPDLQYKQKKHLKLNHSFQEDMAYSQQQPYLESSKQQEEIYHDNFESSYNLSDNKVSKSLAKKQKLQQKQQEKLVESNQLVNQELLKSSGKNNKEQKKIFDNYMNSKEEFQNIVNEINISQVQKDRAPQNISFWDGVEYANFLKLCIFQIVSRNLKSKLINDCQNKEEKEYNTKVYRALQDMIQGAYIKRF